MKLQDATKATIPGVGKISLLNVSSLLALFLGMVAVAFMWPYANRASNKARNVVEGYVPSGAQSAPASTQSTLKVLA